MERRTRIGRKVIERLWSLFSCHISLRHGLDVSRPRCQICRLGDYAQMAELAGFPEVGVLALFYYRAGGDFIDGDVGGANDDLATFHSPDSGDNNNSGDENGGHAKDGREWFKGRDCGCGMKLCGSSPCFVPTSIRSSNLIMQLLQSLAKLEKDLLSKHGPPLDTAVPASSVLEMLSKRFKQERKQQREQQHNLKTGHKDVSIHTFTQNSTCSQLPSSSIPKEQFLDDQSFQLLRFWETAEITSPKHHQPNHHHPKQQPPPAPPQRTLSPLLQTLLLKLLYSSPCGMPFLYLACHAVPHMSIATQSPLTSNVGTTMAQRYKSHWAYFVFIRSCVLGERVKIHRRNTVVPYHVPVWDIVHGLDQRCCHRSLMDGGTVDVDGEGYTYRDIASFLCMVLIQLDPTQTTTIKDSNFQTLGKAETDSLSLTSLLSPSSPCVLPRIQPNMAFTSQNHKPIFAIGDSHVLSIGWQTIQIPPNPNNTNNDSSTSNLRTIIPYPATGLKAWHTQPTTKFFTHTNLTTCLDRLPPSTKTILLSAGEIDCREGIGGSKLEGLYDSCFDMVEATARGYVHAVTLLAVRYDLQVLILPVAPHAYRSERNGKAGGRALRRERMVLWNDVLRKECAAEVVVDADAGAGAGDLKVVRKQRVFFLDYVNRVLCQTKAKPNGGSSSSLPLPFVLDNAYNADFTHMNSAFLPFLEEALLDCGCDASLL